MSDNEFKGAVIFLLVCAVFPVHYSWATTIAFWLVAGFCYGLYRLVKGLIKLFKRILNSGGK